MRARGLTKTFGDFLAVDGIDVEVHKGEAFGFLGPNGAGKSSTMRMIGCVSPVTSGELTIFGLDPERDGPEIRARLGVVPQKDTLDEELTVRRTSGSTAATSACPAPRSSGAPSSCSSSRSCQTAPPTASNRSPAA